MYQERKNGVEGWGLMQQQRSRSTVGDQSLKRRERSMHVSCHCHLRGKYPQ